MNSTTSTAGALTLYGFGPTRSLRTLWALKELGVDFEFVPVNLLAGEQNEPGFRRLNPAGKVPVLVDGERVLTESIAILLYLAEKYPASGLVPSAPEDRAQTYRWTLFVSTELEQHLFRMFRHTSLYPQQQRLPAEVQMARGEFAAMAAVLENHMAGRQFVVGDALTIADCITAHTLDWANEMRLLEHCPNLRGYLARMYARPRAPLRIAAAYASVQAPG